MKRSTIEIFEQSMQYCETEEEIETHVMLMIGLHVGLLRGLKDNKFVQGFLTGAINEENPLTISPQRLN